MVHFRCANPDVAISTRIAPPVGARIADGASVAQGILEFPYPLFGLALCAFFGPFRERSSRMD
jgi:hypothetical protein